MKKIFSLGKFKNKIKHNSKTINILKNLFIIKNVEPFNNNTLIIHIRGGDIISYKMQINRHYIIPPISYYKNIIDNNNF